ncbi:indole-3-glycerol phosphate synthase TrpC [Bacillus tuaregi]|uniref:indole-3-glycerol phosphate synthase TrpC n=1 Tax=Bacillus tuaregi TaxID=1816695 RepID=UPI0008F8CE86|nr:indole-3-glycerol phosphate synthase TrpC [Bacillus tuaregi]
MATILDTILSEKKIEIDDLYRHQTRVSAYKNLTKQSFISILEKAEELAIIAEYKRASPSKGDISTDKDPAEQASSYIKYGASAVSVLTDKRFFKGDFADLEAVRKAIDAPILCKDFIIDRIQIDIAKASGANLILLIAAAMKEEKLADLYQYAKSQQLDVLMEVHNEAEVDMAIRVGAKIIGVNNRNLKTFEVDLSVTERLSSKIKKAGAFLISESGIKTIEDVKRVVNAGANGILVGETFMRADNLSHTLKEMKLPIQKGAQI